MIGYGLAILVVLAAGLAAWVRLAPSDPARWHVDPAATPDPTTPNFARADVVLPGTPAAVAARLAAVAAADGATVLAGSALHTTWVSRSRLMGYPDYTTIRLEPAEGGTRLIGLARARFGSGDWGVNRARLDRWLAALRAG
jgi:uncharacterized protein (DUF1499 family)